MSIIVGLRRCFQGDFPRAALPEAVQGNRVCVHVRRDLSLRTADLQLTGHIRGKRCHREAGHCSVIKFQVHHLAVYNIVVAMIDTAAIRPLAQSF